VLQLCTKQVLEKKVAEDSKAHPNSIALVISENDTPAKKEDEDDFFSTWDKESNKTPTSSAKPVPSTGNVRLGFGTTPKTTSTSRLGAGSTLRSKPAVTNPSKFGLGSKLGAKKVNINFDEAEAQAKEEAELKAAQKISAKSSTTTSTTSSTKNSTAVKGAISSRLMYSTPASDYNDTESLTKPAGPRRLGFGATSNTIQAPIKTSSSSGFGAIASHEDYDDSGEARSRFGNTKALSSDQFFERGAYDPNANTSEQERLSQFTGAASLSSDQYFGRSTTSDSNEGDLDEFGRLEADARRLISTALENSNIDMSSLRDALQSGGQKLADALDDFKVGGIFLRYYMSSIFI